MNFEWTVTKVFADIPEREYINPCCIGGDEILNQIKPDISTSMNIAESQIAIYQEDWGWALEFSKDDVYYFLGVNSNYNGGGKTDFTVDVEANRKVKNFFFSKKVEAAKELHLFAEILSNIAKKRGFEMN